MADRKQNTGKGGSGREGFGDDAGTRVGRPDAGRTDERSTDAQMARLSETSADERGIEGSTLGGSEREGQSGWRAAGGGETESGAEAARGVHEEQQQGGKGKGTGNTRGGSMGASGESSASGTPGRSGSEPLGRTNEHQGGYGGQGGTPRTSSDSRGSNDPQVGATGRDQQGGMSAPNKDNVGG